MNNIISCDSNGKIKSQEKEKILTSTSLSLSENNEHLQSVA